MARKPAGAKAPVTTEASTASERCCIGEVASAFTDAPPPWLTRYLQAKAVPLLTQFAIGARRIPKRRDMREKLAKISSLAKQLSKLLEPCDFAADAGDFMVNIAAAPMAVPPPDLVEQLRQLSKRASDAAQSVPKGAGSDLARPMLMGSERPPTFKPPLLAVMIVSELWIALNGKAPVSKGGPAILAAEAIWSAAVGTKDPDWEGQFEAVKQILAHPGAESYAATFRNFLRENIKAAQREEVL